MLLKRITLIILIFSASACMLTKPVKTGEVYYAEKQYALAAPLLKNESENESDINVKAKKTFLTAECYRLMNNTTQAETYYKKAIELDYDPIAYFYYASMLKVNGNYKEALTQLEIYQKRNPFDDLTEGEIISCKLALEWINKPLNYRVNNLMELNSSAFDYSPFLINDNKLLFTSDRPLNNMNDYGWTGKKFSSIYEATAETNRLFSAITPLAQPVNDAYNNGAACMNKAGNEIYFTRCGSDGNADDYCKIVVSFKDASGSWSEPQVLTFFDDTVNVQHPFLSSDGRELYMSSDSRDGYGGKDIYVSSRTAEGWSTPVNLGAIINTSRDEVFPTLNNGDLFFSSNGHSAMGGLDIFQTRKNGNRWSNPVNLKYPINSSGDDFGLIYENINDTEKDSIRSKGYLTSSRPGGLGSDDIYRFIQPRLQICILSLTIQEKVLERENDPNSKVIGTRPLASADISMQSTEETGNQITYTYPKMKSDSNGLIKLIVPCNTTLRINASKQDYFSKTDLITIKRPEGFEADTSFSSTKITLDKIYRNVQITLSNIYYDLNKWNIRPDAAKVLDTLVILMKENPDLRIELGSHTDSRSDDKYNLTLSQKRAQSAVDYIASKGIDKNRLLPKGYGETMLVNHCSNGISCTEEQHQQNRRTTFKVLDE
jgi:outer membrane protein OmpA-like peptidoglycan-associated protein/tetratricopeptide (TPR) repeat protein